MRASRRRSRSRCRSAISPSRWRARSPSSGAISRSIPTIRRACARRWTACRSAPALFETPSSIYLGLDAARRGLDGARERRPICARSPISLGHGAEPGGRRLAGRARSARGAARAARGAGARRRRGRRSPGSPSSCASAMENFLQGIAGSRPAPAATPSDAGRRGEGARSAQDDLDKHARRDREGRQIRRPRAGAKAARRIAGHAGESRSRRKAAARAPRAGKRPLRTRPADARAAAIARRDLPGRGAGRNNPGAEPGKRGQGAPRASGKQALRERLEREHDALRRSGEGAPTISTTRTRR